MWSVGDFVHELPGICRLLVIRTVDLGRAVTIPSLPRLSDLQRPNIWLYSRNYSWGSNTIVLCPKSSTVDGRKATICLMLENTTMNGIG
jgi:hypothetical protein